MKNKTFATLALLSFLIFFTQCKKDYPDDIPKWVRVEIQKFKKVTPDCICYSSAHDQYTNPYLSITEYTINNEKIYAVSTDCRGGYGGWVTIFDYNKTDWAVANGMTGGTHGETICLTYLMFNNTSSRLIWSGKMY
jgi:hypothetical protein